MAKFTGTSEAEERRFTKEINRWVKRIAAGLDLSIHDVSVICKIGGMAISPTRVKKWGLPTDHFEFLEMTPREMDAFTRGLVTWLQDAESVN